MLIGYSTLENCTQYGDTDYCQFLFIDASILAAIVSIATVKHLRSASLEDSPLKPSLPRLHFNFLLLDVLDIRLPRTCVEELNELVQTTLIALSFAHNASIVGVLHPACDVEFACFSLRCVAIRISVFHEE